MSVSSQISEGAIPVVYLTLAKAAKRLPCVNGRHIHVSTIFRWTRGLRGVHLQYWRIGRKIVTTEQALTQFFKELAAQDKTAQSPGRVTRKHRPRRTIAAARQRSIEAANQVLFRAGILPSENRQTVSASGGIG